LILLLLISIFSITVNLGLGQLADITVTDQWIGKTRPLHAKADIMNAVVVDGKIYTVSGGFLTPSV
jgi:hypothetical protein